MNSLLEEGSDLCCRKRNRREVEVDCIAWTKRVVALLFVRVDYPHIHEGKYPELQVNRIFNHKEEKDMHMRQKASVMGRVSSNFYG